MMDLLIIECGNTVEAVMLGDPFGYLNKEILKGEKVATKADFYLTGFKILNFIEKTIVDMIYDTFPPRPSNPFAEEIQKIK